MEIDLGIEAEKKAMNTNPAGEITTPQLLNTFKISVGHRFGMIDKPSQFVDRMFSMHTLEDVQKSFNRLIIGRMNSPRPFRFGKLPDNRFDFRFHSRFEVMARLQEVLKVGCAPREILAGSVDAEQIGTFTGLRHTEPTCVIAEFFARPLRE